MTVSYEKDVMTIKTLVEDDACYIVEELANTSGLNLSTVSSVKKKTETQVCISYSLNLAPFDMAEILYCLVCTSF